MKLSDIIPAKYNPRKDLKPNDFEYQKLKGSLDRFGLVEPLVVNTRNNVLISGHQRLKVLLESGAAETEVVAVDLDEAKEKSLNLAMNKIEGMWDYEKLESLLSEFDTEDIEFAGFTKAEIESMFADCEEPDFTESEKEEPQNKYPPVKPGVFICRA